LRHLFKKKKEKKDFLLVLKGKINPSSDWKWPKVNGLKAMENGYFREKRSLL
jgi:hypothetical protein